MLKRVNILMASDPDYFQHMAVCLVSLLASNRRTHFNVVILVTHYTTEAADKLRKSVENHLNLTLQLVTFDSAPLSQLPHPNPHYPPEIYARFWLEDYFPPDVERVIYLDGDIVVVGELDELLTLPLGENVLAAVPIPGSSRAKELGYNVADGYFNSGVMVINLKRWRNIGAREILITTAHAIAGQLKNPDQDVLNYCFHDQYVKLDYVWNAITPYFRQKNSLGLSRKEIRRVARQARIVHFSGASKPWQYLCTHPFKRVYLQCLATTEWREFSPADYSFTNVLKRLLMGLLGQRQTVLLGRMLRAR
jgi:lipopolysaccharide biosynthesis glycosyltransferase